VIARIAGRGFEDPRLALPLALLAPVVGVLAVRSPFMTLALALGLAVVLLALRRLIVAVGLFTMLTFFEGAPIVSGHLSLVKLSTLAILLSWIGIVSGRSLVPSLFGEHPVIATTAVVLGAWATASILWAPDGHAATSGAFRLAQMMLLLFVVHAAIRNGDELRLFAHVYVAGAVLTALVPLLGIAPGSEAGAARFGGYLGNPNNLAAVLLPALALTGFMWIGTHHKVERRFLFGCGVLLLVTLFLTQSRGGLVGLGAACLAAIVLGGPARRRAIAFSLILVAAGSIYYAIIAPTSARAHATSFSSATSTGRVDLWHIAGRMFVNHPFQGVGIDNFTVVAPSYLEGDVDVGRSDLILRTNGTLVHNTYLNVFTELGVVGGILFLTLLVGIMGVTLGSVRSLAESRDRASELLARGLASGAIGMLVAYVFFSAQFEKQLWLVLGALVAVATVARARRLHQPGGAARVALSSRT
jgi:O-antigen ligase